MIFTPIGVQPERLLDAFNVKHCALSLVGEPIMYPRINEMLHALHDRKISTFLVTNAQVRIERKLENRKQAVWKVYKKDCCTSLLAVVSSL